MATFKIGPDGLTVNQRAEILGNALGLSKSCLSAILLRDVTYFSQHSGNELTPRMKKVFSVIFPNLDLNWFVYGIGEFDPSKVDDIGPLRVLAHASEFRKYLGDPVGEEAAIQYIRDHGVDVDAFVSKYRDIYPAIANYKTGTPAPAPQPQEPPQNDVTLIEIIASQQRTIERLTFLLDKQKVQ